MSHGDRVETLPPGFMGIAASSNAPLAAMANDSARFYGVQFHPEVMHTRSGAEILERFVREICGCDALWDAHPADRARQTARAGRQRQWRSDQRRILAACWHRHPAWPPVATERLTMTSSGQVRYQLKTPYRDGTTHIVLEPLDLVARLTALVPPPRMHLTRYHGVFAPHSKLRAAVTPAGRGKGKARARSRRPMRTPSRRPPRDTWQ